MFGGGILAAGEKGKLAKDLVSTLYAVIERVMAFIIALSPIGVFHDDAVGRRHGQAC